MIEALIKRKNGNIGRILPILSQDNQGTSSGSQPDIRHNILPSSPNPQTLISAQTLYARPRRIKDESSVRQEKLSNRDVGIPYIPRSGNPHISHPYPSSVILPQQHQLYQQEPSQEGNIAQTSQKPIANTSSSDTSQRMSYFPNSSDHITVVSQGWQHNRRRMSLQ